MIDKKILLYGIESIVFMTKNKYIKDEEDYKMIEFLTYIEEVIKECSI